VGHIAENIRLFPVAISCSLSLSGDFFVLTIYTYLGYKVCAGFVLFEEVLLLQGQAAF
jgi:hypothetical protein